MSVHLIVVIQLSCVQFFAIPWTAGHQASLSFTNSQSLLKLMSIELVMPSNHLIFCHPLLLLPSIFPSIRVFSNELALTLNKYTFNSYTWCFNIDTSQTLLLVQGLGKIFLFILLKNSFVGYKVLGRYKLTFLVCFASTIFVGKSALNLNAVFMSMLPVFFPRLFSCFMSHSFCFWCYFLSFKVHLLCI